MQDQSGTNHRTMEHVSLDVDAGNQGISELEKIFAQKTFTEYDYFAISSILGHRFSCSVNLKLIYVFNASFSIIS